MSHTPTSPKRDSDELSAMVEEGQAAVVALSQDDVASTESIRPSTYGTKGSEETIATTIGSVGDNGNHGIGEAIQNLGLGAANTAGLVIPHGDPITTAAIGAQFAGQLQQNYPFHPHEQRQARMARLREALTELNIEIPEELLSRLDNANYNMEAPGTFVEQYTVLRARGSPMARWESAEDAWNAFTMQFRPTVQEAGVLYGWDELEPLPFTNVD